MYDVLVIGNGPAGVSAALTLRKQGVSVAMASLMQSGLTHNENLADYYGVEGLTGEELYLNGVRQAKHAGVAFFEQQIIGLERQGDLFTALGHTPLQAKCVLLAVGKEQPCSVPDFAKGFLHKGVHLRAEQDGFYYRNRMVGVLGGGPYAIGQAQQLTKIARTVTLFTNDDRLTSVPKSMFVNRYQIAGLGGDTQLQTIHFANQTSLNLDALFLADRVASACDLCTGVGAAATDEGVQVDQNGMTDVQGLFAAGDCTGHTHSLPHRVYDGHRVAMAMVTYLKG